MQTSRALEFDHVSVLFPTARIPFVKEWIVRKARGTADAPMFPALTDVSLSLQAGECLGVIGPNGAGKSTLLRVAAGILVPSSGRAVLRGSVAPLIELGTGFDFELSGRENILFNGALLGRSRRTMLERAPGIIDFSGLAQFIDLPLRTYSTGMVARLAFAVATAVDADVILLDEILSVGDSEFHDRCERRILDFRNGGRTMFLVSHDLGAIEKLCDRAVFLDEGRVVALGSTRDVLRAYRARQAPHELRLDRDAIVEPAPAPVDLRRPPRVRPVAVLAPVLDDDAPIETRYAAAESAAAVATAAGGSIQMYEAALPLRDVLSGEGAAYSFVLTDPTLAVDARTEGILLRALKEHPGAVAAVPVANVSEEPAQRRDPLLPYASRRQFEDCAAAFEAEGGAVRTVLWSSADPGLCLLRTEKFRSESRTAATALQGKPVAVVPAAFVHRFHDFRYIQRPDLLQRVRTSARSVLEIGGGASWLGDALRKRQACRVTAIEQARWVAPQTAANVDRLLVTDSIEETLSAVGQTFDAIVMSERFASLGDPARFLSKLRVVANPGAQLLLSVHNAGSWMVAADLLRGRFDYTYAGILSTAAMRFFTSTSLRALLEQSQWRVVGIEPQPEMRTDESQRLLEALDRGGVSHSAESLMTRAYYVEASPAE